MIRKGSKVFPLLFLFFITISVGPEYPFRSSPRTTTTAVAAFANAAAFVTAAATTTASASKTKTRSTVKMTANIPNIDSSDISQLVTAANSFASANGLEIEKKKQDDAAPAGSSSSSSSSYFLTAPMSLLPNAFPRDAFRAAQDLAPAFNLAVDRISRDSSFLYETLSGVVRADPYTANLLKLHERIYSDDESPAHLADRFNIHRSDYMLNASSTESGTSHELRQIELNTIASSFASLSCQVSKLHSYLVERFQDETSAFLSHNARAMTGSTGDSGSCGVPENPALERIPSAMAMATTRYKERFGPSKPVAVLFVVQDGESNTVDQRMVEFALWRRHKVPVVRMSLTDIRARLRNEGGVLTLGKYEVGLVYYRAGYAPTDYPGGDDGPEWQARELLENSRATKAPSLGYHLVGTKKVQQQLARPGVLEKFFPDDPDLVAAMRSSFAGLWSLSDDVTEQDKQAVARVLDGTSHDQFVLKPQREGGGYNFYGIDVANKIQPHVKLDGDSVVSIDHETLGEYILMERIFPPLQKAVLLRSGMIEGYDDSLSELGCYGTILAGPDGEIIHNEYAGFLLRTKFANVNEGGVASGFATLSSPYLC